MQIDSSTVLLSGLFVKALIAAQFLVFWLYERRSTWYGWWSCAFFFGAAAALTFQLRGFQGELLAIGVGVAAVIATMGCCWQGARAFNRRRPSWVLALLAPTVWLMTCLLPGFLENLRSRIFVSSLLIAMLLMLTAIEFWRGRSERLLSRWPIIVVLSSLALLFAARMMFVEWLPFPFGALPAQPGSVGTFNMIMFFHVIVLTVLLVAISKERLELEQRTKAQTDPLTGALNRRAFLTRGNRLLLRHKQERRPLALLFLDIDHFKSINDRLGHAGGDDALIEFAMAVQNCLRPTDLLFRVGGEEFCCLLPHTTATLNAAGTPVNTTVSVGIASSETFGYDIDTLMRCADAAVYAAKRQGRNRVATAEPMPGDPAMVASDGAAATT
jgi:GGDEF domain-containing protein